MTVYAATIFAGAFLLFQIQPLIGKYILPWFGGGPGVWTACMLFFQVLLLGGYGYAHLISRWLRPRSQVVLHLTVLACALGFLPITPSAAWQPTSHGNPLLQILVLLTVHLGVPYLALSSTGPLMQHWFSLTHSTMSPYRLYALSNAGSLLALLSFPFFFETHFSRKTQAALWCWGLAGYALLTALCAIRLWRHVNASPRLGNHHFGAVSTDPTRQPVDTTVAVQNDISKHKPATERLLWLLLSACASVLLLATTNKLCQDLAVIPFLWVLPLALYLLSFVICFDHSRWYSRFPFTLALIAALVGLCWVIYRGYYWPLWKQILVMAGGLFTFCMVCHGELYRLRPPPDRLTSFYLTIASGGALGGLLVAVVAPNIFCGYYELQVGAFMCAMLFLAVCVLDDVTSDNWHWLWLSAVLPILAIAGLDWLLRYCAVELRGSFAGWVTTLRGVLWGGLVLILANAWRWRRSGKRTSPCRTFLLNAFAPWSDSQGQIELQRCRVCCCGWMAAGVIALSVTLWLQRERYADQLLYASRNFHGVLRVLEHTHDSGQHLRWLVHGHVAHGYQLQDPARKDFPTLYYSEKSGIGLAMSALPNRGRRIGTVGLGTGTLAAYARSNDVLRFYEINPDVYRLARSQFTFLADSPGSNNVVLGDARLSLAREPSQQFDLLVLDAFSSDTIPVHLLTAEAFQIYDRHLKNNGIIAFHVSNNYLNLEPVLSCLGRRFQYAAVAVDHRPAADEWWLRRSVWVLMAPNRDALNIASIREASRPLDSGPKNFTLWTDDFSSILHILK